MRHAKPDAPPHAKPLQLLFDDVVARPGLLRHRMRRPEELLPGHPVADRRMVPAHDADVFGGEKLLLIDAGFQVRHEADREVDFA